MISEWLSGVGNSQPRSLTSTTRCREINRYRRITLSELNVTPFSDHFGHCIVIVEELSLLTTLKSSVFLTERSVDYLANMSTIEQTIKIETMKPWLLNCRALVRYARVLRSISKSDATRTTTDVVTVRQPGAKVLSFLFSISRKRKEKFVRFPRGKTLH